MKELDALELLREHEEIIKEQEDRSVKDLMTEEDEMLDFLVGACWDKQEYNVGCEEDECKDCVITKIARKYEIEDFFIESKKEWW